MRYFDKRKWGLFISWILFTIILGWLAVSMFNEIYYLRLPWARKEIKSPVSKDKSLLPVEKKAHAEAPIEVSSAEAPNVQEPNIKSLVLSYFPKDQRECVDELIHRESSWNQYADNPISTACGLFQSINCDYDMDNLKEQASWGEAYIRARYNDACTALAFQIKYGYY